MDVLARLATEEPDLSGLPGELTELITACMHRVPRQRPTSSAMLAQLGDFTEAQAGPDEEHAYLPEAAMALIGGVSAQPSARPPSPAEPGEIAATTPPPPPITELPASYKPVPRRKPGTKSPGPGRPGWLQWLRSHMAWAGWASVGAALVVVGVVLGAALSSSSAPDPPARSRRQARCLRPQWRRTRCAARRPATPAAPPCAC